MNPNLDPSTIIPKIYPILAFRDKVVRSISAIVSKIPGLEKLVETITERVTLFVLSLLAPFIQPIINAASEQLKLGSSAVVESSGKHQYEPWTDPYCTDPTHSLLSKDHFSNILNEPAGQVATAILQYVAPRVIYAWDHPDVPVDQVLNDVIRIFHHPALRDSACEVHRSMFDVVKRWVDGRADRGRSLNDILSSDSVRAGRNHSGGDNHTHGGQPGAGGHGPAPGGFNIPGIPGLGKLTGGGSSSSGSPFALLNKRDIEPEPYSQPGYSDTYSSHSHSHSPAPQQQQQQQHTQHWGSFQPYESRYAGGQGVEPAYAMPTAFQQGYEAPYQQPQGQGQFGQTDYPYPGYGAPGGPQQGQQQHDPNAPGQQHGGYGGGYGGHGGPGY